MTDGLEALQGRVAPKHDRPPKVPAVPTRHPRPAAPSAEATSPDAQERMRASAHAPKRAASSKPVRVARLPVTPEQDRWLRIVCAAALADGTRLSEAALLGLALDRLRAGGATWPQLREAVLAEMRQRSRRR